MEECRNQIFKRKSKNERQKQWQSEGELYVSQEEIEAIKSQPTRKGLILFG